mmetsp:Transcript_23804/g.64168  ORF Transcript_23804/g.64168 Transcript_23804/m.64168 type:complete len:218 (-) Transcript_23804:1184-1837(-)
MGCGDPATLTFVLRNARVACRSNWRRRHHDTKLRVETLTDGPNWFRPAGPAMARPSCRTSWTVNASLRPGSPHRTRRSWPVRFSGGCSAAMPVRTTSTSGPRRGTNALCTSLLGRRKVTEAPRPSVRKKNLSSTVRRAFIALSPGMRVTRTSKPGRPCRARSEARAAPTCARRMAIGRRLPITIDLLMGMYAACIRAIGSTVYSFNTPRRSFGTFEK